VPEDFRNRKIHRCWRLAEGWKPKGGGVKPHETGGGGKPHETGGGGAKPRGSADGGGSGDSGNSGDGANADTLSP